MHKIYNLLFFSIGLFGFSVNACVYKVNNNDIDPDEPLVLSYKPSENANNVSFVLKEGRLEIGKTNVDLNEIMKVYKTITDPKQKETLATMCSERANVNINASTVTGSAANYEAAKEINIISKDIIFNYVLLKAIKINLQTDRFHGRSVYLDSQVSSLLLKPVNSEMSVIKGIKIIFNKESKIPFGLKGDIDFESNKIEEPFVMLGAKEVKIHVNELR